jgi:ABC-type bacteriocin/lantibiotic exporter with double-glycine peptidase domain
MADRNYPRSPVCLRGSSRAVSCVLASALLISLACANTAPGVILDVPFVAQPKNGCGAASISMVMQYWQRGRTSARSSRANVGAIQRALYSNQAKGIFASAMERYFVDAGYRTFAIRGRWGDLRENLEKGRPLIVSLAPEGPHDPLHYVVVAGMDWVHNWIFVNDPAQRKLLKIGRADFEKQWAATGDWTLLAMPKQ